MNILEQIVARRREQVRRLRENGDAVRFARDAAQMREGKRPHALRCALERADQVNLIGEFKRGSPSLGLINAEVDPSEIAREYDQAGVRAISVLTEPDSFHGSLEDLRKVRAATDLPILRKDFIVDSLQMDEAAAAGADAVLLIASVLSQRELTDFRARAEEELGLDALVEVHSHEEMTRAFDCGAKLIGVNNRDLRTFQTSIETSVDLARFAPPNAVLVSESGISDASQIARLRQCGYHGFLVGESLMRSDDPGAVIRSLTRASVADLRHV